MKSCEVTNSIDLKRSAFKWVLLETLHLFELRTVKDGGRVRVENVQICWIQDLYFVSDLLNILFAKW